MSSDPWAIPHARNTDPQTSHDAAARLTDKRTMLRTLLLTFRFFDRTAEEAANAAGYTAADGAWKRVSDLKNRGLIAPTGWTRPGSSGRAQAIYRLTQKGLDAL